MKPNTVEPLAKVVGRNVRRLRQAQNATLDDVAHVARAMGLNWTYTRVGSIEAGTRQPKLQSLLILAAALDAPLGELLATDAAYIDLGDVIITSGQFKEMFSPTFVPLVEPHTEVSLAEWVAQRGYGDAAQMQAELRIEPSTLRKQSLHIGLVDQRTADALEMDVDELTAISWELFDGRTFRQQRDRQARETGAELGAVTTELRQRVLAERTRRQDGA